MPFAYMMFRSMKNSPYDPERRRRRFCICVSIFAMVFLVAGLICLGIWIPQNNDVDNFSSCANQCSGFDSPRQCTFNGDDQYCCYVFSNNYISFVNCLGYENSYYVLFYCMVGCFSYVIYEVIIMSICFCMASSFQPAPTAIVVQEVSTYRPNPNNAGQPVNNNLKEPLN